MRVIVTTTINPPSDAINSYLKTGWDMVVVGDKKTPHHLYEKLNLHYLHPDMQEKKYKDLSDCIGWNSIQRRSLGFLEALEMGADIIASVDDDNIPLTNWGENLIVGTKAHVTVIDANEIFDPLSVTEYSYLWHRGFPIQLYQEKNKVSYRTAEEREIMVQADLWNGDPDVDAVCRMLFKPDVTFSITHPYSTNQYSPFNTQNTFFTREAMRDFYLFPGVGRMDDIWGAYVFEKKHPGTVAYCSASVIQKRNEHNLVEDMKNEIIGYEKSLDLIRSDDWLSVLPDQAQRFVALWDTYVHA